MSCSRDPVQTMPGLIAQAAGKTRVPHARFAAELLRQDVEIAHAFPPYERWARVSIGLPEENDIARSAVRKTLHGLVAARRAGSQE